MIHNIVYTEEQKEWARNYFSTHSLKETTDAFNEKYRLCKSEGSIRYIVYEPKNAFYTKEMLDFLKEMTSIPNNTWVNITKEFNKKFNVCKSCKTLTRAGYQLGFHTIRDNNFTTFPKTRYKVGTEKIRISHGQKYIVVKVDSKHNATNENWKYKHYVEWEKYNGKVPENCILIFLDGNTLNCDIKNLRCVSNSELRRLTGNRFTSSYYGKGKITEAFVECINLEKVLKETIK